MFFVEEEKNANNIHAFSFCFTDDKCFFDRFEQIWYYFCSIICVTCQIIKHVRILHYFKKNKEHNFGDYSVLQLTPSKEIFRT